MKRDRKDTRILIYSHDTFGLGHLRRCRTIAHALVDRFKHLSVLILSGSPIIGSFDFRSRVDFVRVPGVVKLRNGEYTPLNLHIDVEQMLSMRGSIIRHTAEAFDPDIFIVDKEPLGLRGEVLETLQMLKQQGTRLILGLRDVMDEPKLLAPEWQRKKVLPALRDLYDEIWIYGLPQICEPLDGISLPASVRKKITYTGYLAREVSTGGAPPRLPEITKKPYILVTTGGGGVSGPDGAGAVHATRDADRIHEPCRAPQARGRDHLPQQPRGTGGRRQRRGRDGRLQHLLRGVVAGQARADHSAHQATAGAVHPGVERGQPGPGRHAAGRRRP